MGQVAVPASPPQGPGRKGGHHSQGEAEHIALHRGSVLAVIEQR